MQIFTPDKRTQVNDLDITPDKGVPNIEIELNLTPDSISALLGDFIQEKDH